MTQLQAITPPPVPVPVDTEVSAIISLIERAARDHTVDMDKMERLLLMRERMEDRAAQSAFNTSMASAQSEVIPVLRNKLNKHTNAKYADLAAFADAALPIAHKHGFGFIFSEFTSARPECLGLVCTVTHAAGHRERYEFNVPLDGAGMKGGTNKTAVQTYGSTSTYARRYALKSLLNLAETDNDGNAATPLISDEQAQLLRELITETDSDLDQFLRFARTECITDIAAKDFGRLHAQLLIKQRKQLEARNEDR